MKTDDMHNIPDDSTSSLACSGELKRSKRSFHVYTVDSFDEGIAFGQHRLDRGQDARDFCALQLSGPFSGRGEPVNLRSRYALHKENPFWELERYLLKLSRQRVLGSATIYFGTTTDPFVPFEGKFDASIKFLQLFERFTPGLLVIQTRSPLVVLTIPVLKKLGQHAAVTIGIETCDEDAIQRYTPGQPRLEDRLRTITALRRLGVEVTLQVSPLLPYGDWRKGAAGFASLLDEFADYIHVQALAKADSLSQKRLRCCEIAKRLAFDRKFQWLRPDTARPLLCELERICPEKLRIPKRDHLCDRQISIFAA